MADTSLAITTEYVQCFLKMVGKGISWPDTVLESMREQDLHQLDVTYVITHGEVIDEDKEAANGTTYIMTGETCDDIRIRVEFWLDPNQLDFRILTVDRL